MALGINLLPDDMQDKGRLPKIKIDPKSRVDGIKKQITTNPPTPPMPISKVEEPEVPQKMEVFNNEEFLKEISQDDMVELDPVVEVAPKIETTVSKSIVEEVPKIEKTIENVPVIKETVASDVKKVEDKKIETPVTKPANNQTNTPQPKKFKFDWRKIVEFFIQIKPEHGPETLGINLVPTEVETLSYRKIFTNIALALVPAIILVSGLFVIAKTYATYVKNETEQLASQLNTTISLSDDDIRKLEESAAGLQKKALVMQGIISRHIYWTELLDFMEKIFISDVYIKSMTAETKGSIIVSAEASSYTSVAKQYLLLQMNPDIKSVSITGANRESPDKPVKFSIKLDIWPYILYPNINTEPANNNQNQQ